MMRNMQTKEPTPNRQLLANLPLHLMFPTPIPEPPRVINSRPLVSDISDTSMMSTVESNIPRFKTKSSKLNSNIKNSHNKRRQHREVTYSESEHSDTSSDGQDCCGDEHQRCQANKSKQLARHKSANGQTNKGDDEAEQLRCRLEQVQLNLKEQINRLPAIKSKLIGTAYDNELAVAVPQATNEMLEYVKRSDQQLQEINQKIEALLHFQQAQALSSPLEGIQTSPNRITINQQHNVELTHEIANGGRFIQKRSIQTSFSADPNDLNYLPPPKPTQDKEMSPDFLNTSIEKARNNLRKNLTQKAKECTPRIISRKTKPKVIDYQPSVIIEDVNDDCEREGQEHMFDNMLHNISEILERNSSFESSGHLHPSSDSLTSSTRSHGRRSSCSNTPTSESNFVDHLSLNNHSSPRLPPKSSMPRYDGTGIKFPKGRFIRSEESLFVHRLATKYEVNESDPGDIFESYNVAKPHTNKQPRHSKVTDRLSQQVNKILNKYENDYDFQTYGLPDHHTSVATREYLDKYGLTYPSKRNTQNDRMRRKKRTQLISSHEPLFEANEETSSDENKDQNLPNTKRVTTRIEKVKPTTITNGLDRILDLDAIKNLPKLT